MSSQHRRPLYAFLVLTIVCGVFMGYSFKAEALRGIIAGGVSSLASQVIHLAPVIHLVESDRAGDVRRDPALTRAPGAAPEPAKAVEQPSSSKAAAKPEDAQNKTGEKAAKPGKKAKWHKHAKPGKKAKGHKHAKRGEKAAKPDKKAKGQKQADKKKPGQRR